MTVIAVRYQQYHRCKEPPGGCHLDQGTSRRPHPPKTCQRHRCQLDILCRLLPQQACPSIVKKSKKHCVGQAFDPGLSQDHPHPLCPMLTNSQHQAVSVPGMGRTAQLQAYLSICKLAGHMLSHAAKAQKTATCKGTATAAFAGKLGDSHQHSREEDECGGA